MRVKGTPSFPQPQVVGTAGGATAGDEHGVALEDVGGARLLVSDVRVALLLLDEARYRAVKRLFGVSRDQSWPVTLIALGLLASAAHDKAEQMLSGPGGPSRADVALGAAALRELAGIPGPSSRDTPLIATLVTIALVGAVVRPGLTRTVHGIRTSTRRVRQSFNHRYRHLLPTSARWASRFPSMRDANRAVDVEPPGDQASEKVARSNAPRLPTHRPTNGPDSPASSGGSSSRGNERRFAALSARIGTLVRAIEDNDEAKIEEAILRLSESRRVFAPLAFAVSAFAMLFNGLRLLVTNWRLTLVQILPAMWIWLAMFDLKAHVLHGKSFTVLRGSVLIPIGLLIIAITIASFFLNAVFAFAVSRPGRPEVRPAFAQARQHLRPIMASGAVIGVLLAFSTIVVTRWGRPWFTISLGIVVGVMMVSYVAVPARLIGAKPPKQSKRDKVWGTAVGGALSATVCTPPYVLGRVGILALGSSAALVFIIGIFAVSLGVTLHAGATGAVRAIKISATLTAARHPPDAPASTS